jgi:hypothetical protein
MTDTDHPVHAHMQAAAALFHRALQELRVQTGDEAYVATAVALRSGSIGRITTSLSLAGAMLVSFDLISPTGQEVNLGCVEFESEAPSLN